jgi:hypothetical protein
MWNVVTTIAFVAALAALAWFAHRIEPHWASKDGMRFTCRVQKVDAHHQPDGRWREARAEIHHETVRIVPKALGSRLGAFEMRRVARRLPDEVHRRVVFVLEGEPMLAIRVPRGSRAVAALEAITRDPSRPGSPPTADDADR